jgi:hypothetical protein
MAHSNLHMAAGMLVGTAVTAPQLLSAWRAHRPLARPLGLLLVATYAAGVFALLPSLIGLAIASPTIHDAWWADLFILHRTIDRRSHGGLLIGELVIAACFVGQYLLLLLALRRASVSRDRGGRGGRGTPGSGP